MSRHRWENDFVTTSYECDIMGKEGYSKCPKLRDVIYERPFSFDLKVFLYRFDR